MAKKGIQMKSADTSIIENRMRNTQPGDVVTYAELSKLLGRDVREYCRGNMSTALHTLIKESIFYDCIINEGYRRLDVEEANMAADHYRQRIRKTTRRGLTHLQNIPFDQLSEDGKKKHMTQSAQLGAIDLFASSKATKRIESAVKSDSNTLAIGETLKLFGG